MTFKCVYRYTFSKRKVTGTEVWFGGLILYGYSLPSCAASL